MTTEAFAGWPAGAFDFLRELEDNNERDWFKANRPRYEELLRGPMTALGEDLAALGRPHLFRPFNDTRFHSGPPIKEHVGLAIGMEGAGGYYVEISLDGLLMAAGLYAPQSDQVERLRAAVADGRRSRRAAARDRARGVGEARARRARPQARAARLPRRASARRAAALPARRRVPPHPGREVDEHARRGRADRGGAGERDAAGRVAARERRAERAPARAALSGPRFSRRASAFFAVVVPGSRLSEILTVTWTLTLTG